MNDPISAADLADKYSRKRARMMPILAFFFLTQQAAYFSNQPGQRLVDHFRVGAWLVLATVILLALVTGGAWLRPRTVRALMEDDITRANRASAIMLGFILAMVIAIAAYVALDFWALSARQVLHLVVSVGLASALIRFAILERRALG